MAIRLQDKPNAVAPNATYPYGAIQDDTGSNNGVPVNTLVYGDFHQFFASLMAAAGAAFSNIPDEGVYNGGLQQYYAALITVIQATIADAIATQTIVNAGTSNTTLVTPLTLATYIKNIIFGAWVTDTNTGNWALAAGATGATIYQTNVEYFKIGKLLLVKWSVIVNAPSGAFAGLTYTNSTLGTVGLINTDSCGVFDITNVQYGIGTRTISGASGNFNIAINPLYPSAGWASSDFRFSGTLAIQIQ